MDFAICNHINAMFDQKLPIADLMKKKIEKNIIYLKINQT